MFDQITYRGWLIDFAIASFALLTMTSLAVTLVRQPARRILIIEMALFGCLALAVACLFSNRPRWYTGGASSLVVGEVISAPLAEPATQRIEWRNDWTEEVDSARVLQPGGQPSVPNQADRLLQPTPQPETDTQGRSTRSVSLWQLARYVHAVIAGFLLSFWLLAIGALRRLRRRSPVAPQWIADLFREIAGPEGDRVRLLIDTQSNRVFAFGWLRPAIVLTVDLCRRANADSLRWSLAHEWSHVRRRDARAWHLVGLAGPLCFFQPAFWYLRRQLRLSQEHLADARGAAEAPTIEDYARFLVRLADGSNMWPVASVSTLGPARTDLSARIVRLVRDRGRFETCCPRRWSLACLGAVALVIGLAASFSLTAAPPDAASAQDADDRQSNGNDDLANFAHLRVVDEKEDAMPGFSVDAYDTRSYRRETLSADAMGMIRIPKNRLDQRETLFIASGQAGKRIGWERYNYYPQNEEASFGNPLLVRLMPRTRRLSGSIRNAAGDPIPGVRIAIVGLGNGLGTATTPKSTFGDVRYCHFKDIATRRSPFGEAVTDESGGFSLRIPANTGGSIEVHHPRYVASWFIFAPKALRLDPITMVDAGGIIGIVVDGNRKAIEGARISARCLDQGQRIQAGTSLDAVTDAKGMYRLDGLAPGVHGVYLVQDPKRPRQTAQAIDGVRVRAGEDALADMRITDGKRLHGTVVDVSNGKPVPGLTIFCYGSVRPRSLESPLIGYTDARGRFEFFVPPGKVELQIHNREYTSHPRDIRTVMIHSDRELPAVDLKVHSMTVRGVVEDATGKPVPNAAVRLVSPNATTRAVESDEEGRFEIRAGRNRARPTVVSVDHPDFEYVLSERIDPKSDPKPLRIVTRRAEKLTVTGRAFGPDGKPWVGARATLWLKRESGRRQREPIATTDKNGRYSFDHVRSGDAFRVRVDDWSFSGASTEEIAKFTGNHVEMAPIRYEGKQEAVASAPADQDAETAQRTLTGYLVDEEDRPVVGVGVNARMPGKYVSGFSDREGMFLLTGLSGGVIDIDIRARGFARLKKTVLVGEERIELVLKRAKD